MNAEQRARQALTDILVEECRVDASSITDASRLQDDLGLDSMTLLSLALEVENFLGCALEEDPENVHPPKTSDYLSQTLFLSGLEAKVSPKIHKER